MMERALNLLHGGGPQIPMEDFARPYDHPYFSQVFLAGLLAIIGYPDSFNGTNHTPNVELLYLMPRILMGIVAVLDTFIIYAICERKYNTKIAFTSAILFAVMPLSWLTRRLYIDPLQLPFILLAILFAVYVDHWNKRYLIPMTLLSGLFLGLAIFTKVPAICMIPLVGYLVLKARSTKDQRSNLKLFLLWLIPVVLIPAIWPASAIINNQFDIWYNDVLWQAGREGSLLDTFNSILRMDPVLVLAGLAGIAYTIVFRRDPLLLLWVVPFIIFFSFFVGRMAITFWVPIIPAFCIAAGILIADVTGAKKTRVKKEKADVKSRITYYLEEPKRAYEEGAEKPVGWRPKFMAWTFPLLLAAIALTGLLSTTALITTNLNSTYLQLYKSVVEYLIEPGKYHNADVLLVANAKLRSLAWIPEYIIYDGYDDEKFKYRASPLKETFQNKKVVLLSNKEDIERYVQTPPGKYTSHKDLYNKTRVIAEFNDKGTNFDREAFPYTSMIENRGIGNITVRGNK